MSKWKFKRKGKGYENFKKDPVGLTLHEHPGGEWVIKKITLKKETGERNQKKELWITTGWSKQIKKI